MKKGFTLVELIIVITILTILATLGFISYRGYKVDARDSVRLADLSSMQKALELYKTKNGFYPEPDESVKITYSGDTVWEQGVFGESVVEGMPSLSSVPLDPLTKNKYAYSITYDKKEYQIGAILEGDLASLNNTSYASSNSYYAKVVGDYNGKIIKLTKGLTLYVFAVPSILVSDVSDPDIYSIFLKKLFVFDGFRNLPDSYKGNNLTMTGGFNFPGDLKDPLIFKGNPKELLDIGNLKDLSDKFKNIIKNSDLENIEPYKSIYSLDDAHDIVAAILPLIDPNFDIDNYEYPPNNPPVAPSSIPNLSADQNVSYTSPALPTFTDPEGEALEYSIENLPDGLTFDSSSRVISGTPTTYGSYNLIYSASDGINVTKVTVPLEISKDLWIWNDDHTLACKRIGILSIQCKWNLSNIDLSSLDEYSGRIEPYIGDENCIDTSNTMDIYDIDNSYFFLNNQGTRCDVLSNTGSNLISMSYLDSDGNRQTTPALDIPLGLLDIEDSSYYTLHPYGFDFDFTNLGSDIDLEYGVAISNNNSDFHLCDNVFPAYSKTGSVTFENGGSCDSYFGINPTETNFYFKKNSNNGAITNTGTILLPKFVIQDTDYTVTDSGINFDFSSNKDFQGLIYSDGSNKIKLEVDDQRCGEYSSNTFDTNQCSSLFSSWNSGDSKKVVIKYGANSSYLFDSEPKTITKP